MPVLIAVAIVLLVGLLFIIDRTNKAMKRIGRRREANRRLVAAAAVAEGRRRGQQFAHLPHPGHPGA